MNKPKYKKPEAIDLSSIQIAQGSCKSGNIEYPITDYCVPGATAYDNCSDGAIVVTWQYCGDGSDAAMSCENGSSAG